MTPFVNRPSDVHLLFTRRCHVTLPSIHFSRMALRLLTCGRTSASLSATSPRLRQLCVERSAVTQTPYLTDSELKQIDDVLSALGYEDSYGRAQEWHDSLSRCLLG